MMTFSLAPLLEASPAVQLHAAAGTAALVLGAVRLVLPGGGRLEQVLGWSFLAVLVIAALSALSLSRPAAGPSVLGVTPHHGFILLALAGAGAAVLAAHKGDQLGRQRIVSATFAGVLLMAGLFELAPGRMLNAVFTGG